MILSLIRRLISARSDMDFPRPRLPLSFRIFLTILTLSFLTAPAQALDPQASRAQEGDPQAAFEKAPEEAAEKPPLKFNPR